MPGVGRFTETGFVQGLARALAKTPRIADELQSADINQAKFVKAMLEEPGLTDAIGLLTLLGLASLSIAASG